MRASSKKPAPAAATPECETTAGTTTATTSPFSARPLLVLDNGGSTIKAMLVRPGQPVRVVAVPNCVGAAAYAGRGIVGDQLHTLPHYHGFMVRRPTDRGYVVDGLLQAHVWEHVLQRLGVEDEREVELVLTTPFAAPKPVASLLHALVTSRFHFAALTVVSSHFLALLAQTLRPDHEAEAAAARAVPGQKRAREPETRSVAAEASAAPGTSSSFSAERDLSPLLTGTAIVVDVGFSATTVVPYIDGLPVYSSIVRLSVGGKLLTNRLKEHLSFTQVNVLEDGWLINHVRERCCYVAHTDGPGGGWRQRLAARPCKPAARASSAATLYYLPTIPALLPLGCTREELPSRVRVRSKEHNNNNTGESARADISKTRETPDGSVVVEAASLQHLRLEQAAFLIPELLFCPGDIGVPEMGLTQAITRGVCERGLLSRLPMLRPALLSQVCVFGGVSSTRGFHARLHAELQGARQDTFCVSTEALVPCASALPPPFQSVLSGASTETSPVTREALAPLLGAFYLFVPPSPSTTPSTEAPSLESRRWAVQQLLMGRSRVVLTEATKRTSEMDIHTALLHLL